MATGTTPKPKPDMDELVLTFKKVRDTKRATLFEEVLGDQEYSDQGVAVGPLYIKMQALQLLGSPQTIQVTIKPAKE